MATAKKTKHVEDAAPAAAAEKDETLNETETGAQPGNELAEVKKNEVAVAQEPELDDLLSGGDDFKAEDIKIPFIRLLQKLSPQVDKDAAEFIPGAEVGQIINTGTGELYDADKGVPIIVCAYQRELTEWLPKRGGMAKHHGTNLDALKTAREVVNSDGKKEMLHAESGNVLIEAGTYYVLIPDLATGHAQPAVIAMSSSQFTPAKELNALIRNTTRKDKTGKVQANLKPFAAAYILQSQQIEKNNNKWYNWKPERLGLLEEIFPDTYRDLFRAAIAFRETVIQGTVKVDHETGGNPESDVKLPF